MEHFSPQQEKTDMQGMGYLIVHTSTAGGAIPIENAQIKIWNRRDAEDQSSLSGVRHILTSDRDGNTIRLPLPAPTRAISYTPGGIPYAYYNVDVSALGFYPQYFVDVPIYDGITSIQNAYLIPLPEGSVYSDSEPIGDTVVEGTNPLL